MHTIRVTQDTQGSMQANSSDRQAVSSGTVDLGAAPAAVVVVVAVVAVVWLTGSICKCDPGVQIGLLQLPGWCTTPE
jgi:hypothetical protein